MKKTTYLIVILIFISISSAQAQWVVQEKDGMYGYVDSSSGEVKIPYQYPFVFSDTLDTIAFVAVEGKIKAIDRNNKQLFSVFVYDNGPDYLEEGLFRIVDDATTRKMGFANRNGEIVIEPTFFFVTPFSNGLAAFNEGGQEEWDDCGHSTIVGGKWGYIDHKANIVFPAIFDHAWSFSDGKVNVHIGGRNFTLSIDD